MRCVVVVAIAVVLAGCGDSKSDSTSSSKAKPPAPSVAPGPGIASDYGTAGERECYGFDACTAACDADEPGACARLAEHYQSGWGTEQNYNKASELRTAACTAGDPAACFPDRPDGDAYDTARSALIEKCDAGVGRACYVLARWEQVAATQRGEEDTTREEARLDERACEAGYAYSCEIIVIGLATEPGAPYRGNRKQLDDKSRKLRERDCDAGVAFACESLALLHDPSRKARAIELRVAQCKAGYPRSCDRACKLGHKASCPDAGGG